MQNQNLVIDTLGVLVILFFLRFLLKIYMFLHLLMIHNSHKEIFYMKDANFLDYTFIKKINEIIF